MIAANIIMKTSSTSSRASNEERVLKETFNLGDPGNGMSKLLEPNSFLCSIKSTAAAAASNVLKCAKAQAEAKSTDDTEVLPVITTRPEAQEEADCLNQIYQAVIGAKEGATKAITELIGSDITNAILHTADGRTVKGIDQYHLHELKDAVIQGANRPATAIY